MSAGLRFILALARLFALPLSILIAVRLGFLDIKDSYANILWIALLLGLVNLLVRPFVLVLLLLLSLPLFIVLRLPKVLMTGLITFGLLYLTNVLMLKLVCNLTLLQSVLKRLKMKEWPKFVSITLITQIKHLKLGNYGVH